MFRHILGFAAWAPCGVLGKSLPWAVPDGWTLLDVVNVASNLATYNLPATSLPLMAVLRRNSTAALRAGCRSFLSEHAQLGFSVSATQQGPDGLTAQQHTSCAGDQLMVILRGTGVAVCCAAALCCLGRMHCAAEWWPTQRPAPGSTATACLRAQPQQLHRQRGGVAV
jgi:hypothetical protein